MTNVLPAWLGLFRLAAFGFALLQIAYVILSQFRHETPLFSSILMAFLLMALMVAPWFFIPQNWLWWSAYCLVIAMSCFAIFNIFMIWVNYLSGTLPPFAGWSLGSKISFVYGNVWSLFLITQIFVLPVYRKAITRGDS